GGAGAPWTAAAATIKSASVTAKQARGEDMADDCARARGRPQDGKASAATATASGAPHHVQLGRDATDEAGLVLVVVGAEGVDVAAAEVLVNPAGVVIV